MDKWHKVELVLSTFFHTKPARLFTKSKIPNTLAFNTACEARFSAYKRVKLIYDIAIND